MVNFAELKAKAEKVKDASVAKMANTRDRFSSIPSSKVNWDPNRRRAPPPDASASSTSARPSLPPPPPPPPPRTRSDAATDIASGGVGTAPPVVSRASRPAGVSGGSSHAPPPPPPVRGASGYPPPGAGAVTAAADKIDWANLSAADKDAFFGWLDEFFSRYLGVELGPRARRGAVPSSSSPSAGLPMQSMRLAPAVNIATRPQV